MARPYRITHQAPGARAALGPGGAQDDGVQAYLDRLLKLIPGEVVGLYLVGIGFIPATNGPIQIGWTVLCLVGVLAIRTYGTADPSQGEKAQPGAVAISATAFLIWVYTMGGPFAVYGVQVPYVGSLAVLAFTFFVPILYKGSIEA